ncbi:DUF5105 domain-containing protein [Listeria booriae]|uniref:DUF5105 domain-containing protein n=1 Tax=Listeria booriae TaxID=1552123 RepID=A0A7X0ZTL4_9LIST|nr:DUF5105 domain-containing protein [Listeria booriae]MBC1400441.1 DUF5105 domain-containing protein [Listeria booriae]MBC1615833.1 DUF5105 domain-containing protein [Listeria booriae]MBC1649211.1 DUF5105 domain-containing protein [Listeria booriae]MBC2020107.1 DUF5105 domain-containing protein [Listeria booriae]MBC2022947.1 DUF5105 domain-containing protein [Listeria booriae]
MKKKLALMFVLVLTAAITLAACGDNRVEPTEAADVAVNTIIYNKDTDKFKDVFGEDATNLQKEIKEGFKKGFTSSLNITDGSIDKEVDALYDTFTKRVGEVTKYKTKVTKDDKDKPTVEISVNGLDMTTVQADMTTKLQEKVKADPSIQEDAKKAAKAMLEVYQETIAKAKVSDKAVKVKMNLESNKDQWKIKDADTFAQSLYLAFFTGTAQ